MTPIATGSHVRTVIFEVPGSPTLAKRAVAKLPGIISVRADVVEMSVRIRYDPAFVTEGRIKQACAAGRAREARPGVASGQQ